MYFKFIGSILLIVGTSIGAGMLALPIVTAQLGFVGSLILYLTVWFVMTAGSLLSLEVNLWLPKESNLISMAKETLGPVGQVIAWVTYLLLLYSLLSAYIAGGGDLLNGLLTKFGFPLPLWSSSIIFLLLFAFIVYMGIRSVDYINRWLMFTKLAALFLLITLLTPFISADKLSVLNINNLSDTTALTVTITSFGYSIIVPSLRVYHDGNINALRKAIIFGSLIPLTCYIAWSAAILGIIPLHGNNSLIAIVQSNNQTNNLVDTLSSIASMSSVTFFARLFTSICVATSFLGVAISLTDFLADGLNLKKQGKSNFIIHILAFLPPLIIVLFIPGIFVKALEYAGLYCIILLILFPAFMVWRGRYHLSIANGYMVVGGKYLPGLLIIFSILMLLRTTGII